MAGFGAFDRDSGLRRVSRVTKWLVAGSVAAVGIVTAVVAEAAPGSSRTTTPTPTSPQTPAGAVDPAPGPTTTQPRDRRPGHLGDRQPGTARRPRVDAAHRPSATDPAPPHRELRRLVITDLAAIALPRAGDDRRARRHGVRPSRRWARGPRACARRRRSRVQPLPRRLRADAGEHGRGDGGPCRSAVARRGRRRAPGGAPHRRRRRPDARPGAPRPRVRPRLRLGRRRRPPRPAAPAPVTTVARVAGWRAVVVDRDASTLRVPTGVELDLGATAKAFAADLAAGAVHDAIGGGVLVGLGGDIAVAGDAPSGGWTVRVTDDHAAGSGRTRRDGRDREWWPRDLEHHRPPLDTRGPNAASRRRPDDGRAGDRLLADGERQPRRPVSTPTSRPPPRSSAARTRSSGWRISDSRPVSSMPTGAWSASAAGPNPKAPSHDAGPRREQLDPALVPRPRVGRDRARPADRQHGARDRDLGAVEQPPVAALRDPGRAPQRLAAGDRRDRAAHRRDRRRRVRADRVEGRGRSRSCPATGRCGSGSAPSRSTSCSR